MDTQKIVEYFKGIKAEWGKVTWPDKKQVVTSTIMVAVIVFAFTIYTYALDIIYEWILRIFGLVK